MYLYPNYAESALDVWRFNFGGRWRISSLFRYFLANGLIIATVLNSIRLCDNHYNVLGPLSIQTSFAVLNINGSNIIYRLYREQDVMLYINSISCMQVAVINYIILEQLLMRRNYITNPANIGC